jgi:hypothetical protein
MAGLRQSTNLELEIGLYRIALVVAFADIEKSRDRRMVFHLLEDSVHDDERSGSGVCMDGHQPHPVQGVVRAVSPNGTSHHWFRVDRILRAVPLAHEFPVTADAVQWAQGSYAASAKR